MTRSPHERFDFAGLAPPPEAQALAARVAEAEDTPWGPVRVGVDLTGNRHVLIPVPSSLKLRSDRRSSGLHIAPRPLEEDGVLSTFLDIACLKAALFDVFATIAAEMLDAVRREGRDPDAVCIRVLDRWRSLLNAAPSDAPAREKLVGLFGELQHLLRLAALGTHALRSWSGPEKAVQDFRAPGISLEVKGTLKRAGWSVEINGIEQLQAPAGADLFLSVWKLELDDANGVSVPQLAEQVVAAGVDAAELYERLTRVGLAPAHLAAARESRFRIVEHRVWQVSDEFPRLVAASFVAGALPLGVSSLTYVLDLTATPQAALAPGEIDELHRRLMELT